MTDIYFSIPSLGSHHFGRNDFRKNFKWIDNVDLRACSRLVLVDFWDGDVVISRLRILH